MTDFDAQEAILQERRKRYAQQLSDSQAPQGSMAGNTFVAPHALEYLAAGLRGFGALKGQSMAEKELGQLQGQRGEARQSAMANFLRQAQGTPAFELPADQAGPVQPAQAPDMGKAYAALMQAPDQQLQQAGMQGVVSNAQAQAKAQQDAADRQRVRSMLTSMTPQQAIAAGAPPELVKAFAEAPNLGRAKVQFKDVGGQLVPVDEYGQTPQNVTPLDKTGNPFSDVLVRGTSGEIIQNAPLVGAKRDIASAGRPQVNVTNKIENKAAENIAGQVGPMLKESAVAAEGAVRTLDAANRIVSAVNSGKVIAGPLANTRVSVRQAAELLGVGGKDNAEILSNTRSTIRGLAEMTLQGRKQMSGQGAITESESKLAEKAMSGDISDLTPAEISQLAQASARAAQWTIQTHQSRTQAASQLPGMQGLMPFFNTPATPGQPTQAPASSGFKVVR